MTRRKFFMCGLIPFFPKKEEIKSYDYVSKYPVKKSDYVAKVLNSPAAKAWEKIRGNSIYGKFNKSKS